MTWTREGVTAAIQHWVERHGIPPASGQWHPGSHGFSRITFHAGTYPTTPTVRRIYGSWAAALRAAGYEPIGPVKRWRIPDKFCGSCREQLQRREGEARDKFLARRYCNHTCAMAARSRALALRITRIIAMRQAGHTNGEIATILGTTPRYVTRALHEARKRGITVPRAPYYSRGGRINKPS